MDEEAQGSLQREGVEALGFMQQALKLLDCCEGTHIIGAQLDLAISRLREAIADEQQDGLPA